MNRLVKEKSAYLQHAARQKIDWYSWSEEAFEKAAKEDKPVFLSSGAIWCHWCHVMARESFEDDEVARLLNELFVPVKLDRDERPDIDKRYQRALAIMGQGGGWPLNIFLTADKKPFYGGTYFPPNEGFGRPGFKTILKAIGELYRQKKDEVSNHAGKFFEHMKQEAFVPGDLNESMLDEALKNMLADFDKVHGGFGSAPKFPMPGVIEFLIGRYAVHNDNALGEAIRKTLTAMADGGIHDHLGGGFHRYSTDAEWIIPHFEKMADDNAWLLRNYVHAFSVFGDEYFREVTEGIINFLVNELSDPDGGFYTSQDADVGPEDEGGYFTWTDEEFREVLNDKEYSILKPYLLHEKGAMRHNPSKRVLHVNDRIEDLARKAGLDYEEVCNIVDIGKTKLIMERERREKPFIDRALYTSINGMLISSFFEAYRVLKDEEIKEFALKTLRKVLSVNLAGRDLLHFEGVKGLLDDYVNLADAFISAYEATGDRSHLNQADELMKTCIDKFWDSEMGGFFDTEEEVLGTRLKGADDSPQPSSNAIAVLNLIRLSSLTGKEEYLGYAERSLKIFSFIAQAMKIHAGYYFHAMEAFFHASKKNIG